MIIFDILRLVLFAVAMVGLIAFAPVLIVLFGIVAGPFLLIAFFA